MSGVSPSPNCTHGKINMISSGSETSVGSPTTITTHDTSASSGPKPKSKSKVTFSDHLRQRMQSDNSLWVTPKKHEAKKASEGVRPKAPEVVSTTQEPTCAAKTNTSKQDDYCWARLAIDFMKAEVKIYEVIMMTLSLVKRCQ